MLILTRNAGERIFIGNNQEMCITIIEFNGRQVKIGIDAPKDIAILREEVFIRNCNEKYMQDNKEENEDYADNQYVDERYAIKGNE